MNWSSIPEVERENLERYGDIIGLEHPTSSRHPRMSALDRAGQFAPFAALSGFGAVIDDTAAEHLEDYPED